MRRSLLTTTIRDEVGTISQHCMKKVQLERVRVRSADHLSDALRPGESAGVLIRDHAPREARI
jgi:hypothetical protein